MMEISNSENLWKIPLLITIFFLGFPAYAKYGGGSGEPNDPYLIYTAEQLNAIGLNQEDADKYFRLMADIDLSVYKGDSFNRIGFYDPPDGFPDWHPPFTGVFDGNDHTISNFTYVVDVNEPLIKDDYFGEEKIGLFGYVAGPEAQIKNLGLIDPNIYPAATCMERVARVGAIVGTLYKGSITNCYVEGGLVSADKTLGGLVGSNLEGTISNCYTTCDVRCAEVRPLRPIEQFGSTGYSVGGLAGYSRGWIYNCHSTGSIQGVMGTGGLVGANDCDLFNTELEIGVISNSYASGDITGDEDIGGLVGSNSGTISRCYAFGNISGSDDVGGLVGEMIMEEGCVSDSYATGNISGDKDVGGLMGYSNGLTEDSYATGEVSGTQYVGGLIGFNGFGTILRSYAGGEVLGDNNVGGLVGRNGSGTIHHSYAIGNVSGERFIGGVAGSNLGMIHCCYAGSAVFDILGDLVEAEFFVNTVTGGEEVGGLVGENIGDVIHCYSICTVTGNINAGGLVGDNRGNGYIFSSFWDTKTSGFVSRDDGIGRTTEQMQTVSTFLDAGWDFVDETENGLEDIWKISEGLDYPRLWWEKYSGGMGDPNNPYKIATAEDLMLLGDSPEDYDKHFIMIDDVDLDPNLPGGKVFDKAVIAPDVNSVEDGFQGTSFTGVFDGNGHTIWHPTITGKSCSGLFGYVGLRRDWFPMVGKIMNLSIVDANITSSGDYVGGLVGNNYLGELTNCSSTGTISGNSGVGGLVGWNRGNVTNSYSTGVVRGERGVGGLVGLTEGDVTNSYSTATVSGENDVGGLVGLSYSREPLILPGPPVFIPVNDVYNTGSVSVEEKTDGLVVTTNNLQDYRYNVRGGFVINNFSTGAVTGKNNVGGLVGASYGPPGFVSDPWWFPPSPVPVQVTNCYSTASVSGEEKVGGLVGYIDLYGSDVIHCYSTGSVNGSNAVGGLVGSGMGYVMACFWDIESSGQTTSDGGTGKTTEEMQMGSTFTDAGWDFIGETVNGTEDIWFIDEGQDYPRLWWEPFTERPTDDMLFLVVDDFESYNDLDYDDPNCNRIYLTWIDGYDNPMRNGSIVGIHDINPPWGNSIVHSGALSMCYFYDNGVGRSEATANIDNLEIGRDWTIKGVDILSLWFYGDLWNDTEPMFVAIVNAASPAAVVYHSNPDVVLIDDWTEWRIDLQEFADQGVDLTNVNSITIGFGNRINPFAGGSGQMWFDDFRLHYRPAAQELEP